MQPKNTLKQYGPTKAIPSILLGMAFFTVVFKINAGYYRFLAYNECKAPVEIDFI
ncbi:hypothetical protein LASAK_01583 [Latilactobacillus sakei]|nr:hypothetical protein LASAK_01583 [Latilactobacillus sakei]